MGKWLGGSRRRTHLTRRPDSSSYPSGLEALGERDPCQGKVAQDLVRGSIWMGWRMSARQRGQNDRASEEVSSERRRAAPGPPAASPALLLAALDNVSAPRQVFK